MSRFRSGGRVDLCAWLEKHGAGALKKLAALTGLPKETLSRIANGHRMPTLHQAGAIAKACKIKPERWFVVPTA